MVFLIGDDERLVLAQIAQIVQQVNKEATVITFLDGDELIDYAKEYPFDLALLDITMGCCDGTDIAKRLKLIRPDCQILLVTGDPSERVDYCEDPDYGYLLKPATPSAITKAQKALTCPYKTYGTDIFIRTFGHFEVFTHNNKVLFKSPKSRELLACLINQNGCASYDTLAGILYPDTSNGWSRKHQLKKDLKTLEVTLAAHNISQILTHNLREAFLHPEMFICDAYQFQKGHIRGINSYNGRYMTDFSWAKFSPSLYSFPMT